jgi:hypothetical protein
MILLSALMALQVLEIFRPEYGVSGWVGGWVGEAVTQALGAAKWQLKLLQSTRCNHPPWLGADVQL